MTDVVGRVGAAAAVEVVGVGLEARAETTGEEVVARPAAEVVAAGAAAEVVREVAADTVPRTRRLPWQGVDLAGCAGLDGMRAPRGGGP